MILVKLLTHKGFSLIEILVTLVLICLLTALAYPEYRNHLTKVRRSDGHYALLDMAHRLEHHFHKTQTYRTATIGTGSETDVSEHNISSNGWYKIQIETDENSYTLQAVPLKTQGIHDKHCQTMTLNHQGVRGIQAGPSGSPTGTVHDCW